MNRPGRQVQLTMVALIIEVARSIQLVGVGGVFGIRIRDMDLTNI